MIVNNFLNLFSLDLYLFIFSEGEGGRKKRGETSMCCLSCAPYWGTWPAAHTCALTGNQTSHLLVCRLPLSPLNHTSQGDCEDFYCVFCRRYPSLVFSISFTWISKFCSWIELDVFRSLKKSINCITNDPDLSHWPCIRSLFIHFMFKICIGQGWQWVEDS